MHSVPVDLPSQSLFVVQDCGEDLVFYETFFRSSLCSTTMYISVLCIEFNATATVINSNPVCIVKPKYRYFKLKILCIS